MITSLKQTRWWDLAAAALLLAALASVSVRLNNTDWTKYLDVTEILVIIGAILGFALGFTRFSSRISFIFAILYGIAFVPWQLSRAVESSGQDISWLQKMQIILIRLETVIGQLLRNEVVLDSIFFISLMAVLFWFIGVYSGYILIRHGNAWLALFPSGIALLVIHIFDPLKDGRIWYFAAFIFFSLMLIGRVAFLYHQEKWRINKTAMPPYLGLDFIRFSLFTTTAIIILAWTFPTIPSTFSSVRDLTEPVQREWKEFQEKFDNVFASLKSTLNVPVDYYGTTLSLGSGNKLTDEIMFWVEPPRTIPDGVRLYWRARVYNLFDGRQWQTPSLASKEWNPESEIELSNYDQRWEAEFSVISSSFFTALLLPAQPEWTDRIGFVNFIENSDLSVDLFGFHAEPLVRPGQIYTVRSSISSARIYDMQISGTEYPSHITDRYLQVPSSTTERTIQLSQQITSGLDNPYDKTAAIVQFLRDNIAYSETIPPPPPNEDAVDWFLFENKEGFCNYFASSAVIMLRSLGIPSRIVVGYATGEEQDDGRYIIRQREAHAWPEVYFPNLGWVEFEPTPSQPVIERLPGADPDAAESQLTSPGIPLSGPTPVLDDDFFMNQERDDNQFDAEISGSRTLVLLLIVTASLMLIILLFFRMRNRWNFKPLPVILENSLKKFGLRSPEFIRNWAVASTLPQLARSYMEINNALIRLGNRPESTSTPFERAQALNLQIPSVEPYTNLVIYEYQLGLFSTQPPDVISAQKAGNKIRQLAYQEYFHRFSQRIRSFPKKPNQKRALKLFE
jgi:transglutaminase-like putative cysteine protease